MSRPVPSAIARAVAIACLGAGFSVAHAQTSEPALTLRLSPVLRPAPDTNAEVPTFIAGDTMSGSVDREVTLEGDAEVRRGNVVLRADRILFQQVDNVVDAVGRVKLDRGDDSYRGPTLRYDLDNQEGKLGPGEYRLSATATRSMAGRGTAEATEFAGRDVIKLTGTTYTTCPPGDESWILRARDITIDSADQSGEAHGGVVYFMGVPILASPYVVFPVGNQRKTGFLTPSFGVSSSNGFEVVAPFYLNIAPNRDYTFTPRVLSKRGVELGNEFRYLGASYNGRTFASYVPRDRLFQDGGDRWSLNTQHQQGLGKWVPGLSAYWGISRVSDDEYLSDYSRTIVTVTNRQLPQEGGITYGQPWWNALLRVQKFQVLQDPAAPVPIPYERVPQLNVRAFRYDVAGLDLNLETDVTQFDHPTLVRGSRAYAIPSVSAPLIGAGWFITPKMSVNAASYSLDRNTIGQGAALDPYYHRTIPTLSVDSGLVFERDSRLFGRDSLQTLEPRLFYVRTPYRDQSKAPVFDTAIADFNFAQLFNENTFSGQDRIADANTITAALATRWLEPGTGAERLRIAAGQRYYFDDQKVTLVPGTGTVSANRSDYLLSAGGNVLPGVYADATTQFDAANNRPARSNLGIRWTPSPGRIATVNYRYTRNLIEQYDFATQWDITSRWVGVARVNYSTFERRLVEGLIGAEYRSCCWTARFVAHRYATAATKQNTAFFFELELNGFTRIGSSPADALRRNIVGYVPIEARRAGEPGFVKYD
ncbi:MAG TPA: LPS-assembly protein LptD [Burkholderiaceae bacterium]|nr:LPS-assembly protein LptD [Burkholderiaceae bacterium]